MATNCEVTQEYCKNPGETLDYTIDWSEWLTGAETISTSTWAVDTGITTSSPTNSTTITTVWLSGGTLNNIYTVKNTIATSAARTAVRTFYVKVTER